MSSREMGFVSSLKMLTREKGWYKPIAILTLVGWIPLLGQICVLGYAFEWARLTAWGADSSPKQRDLDYGKIFKTGGIALIVSITMFISVGILNGVIFGINAVSLNAAVPFGMWFGGFETAGIIASMGLIALVPMVLNILASTFITAAMMRATVYDSFSAGWRLDRLCQMIARDFGGFLHAFAVSVIGGLVTGFYMAVVGFLSAVAFAGGAVAFAGGAVALHGLGNSYYGAHPDLMILNGLLQAGPSIVLLLMIVFIFVFFVGNAIAISMQMVSINAMGQWFSRFDIGRWGVSSDPLPDGVIGRADSSTPTSPIKPDPSRCGDDLGDGGSRDADQQACPAASGEPVPPSSIPLPPVTADDAGDDPVKGDEVGDDPVSSGGDDDPKGPIDIHS
ncbi:MAG: DUF4013 domain-containing protein [Collinsella sp.]|nr:DUF4013 domain-containing protein [Collinsella sp.]